MASSASNPKRSASTKEHRCNLCGKIFDSSETLNSYKKCTTVRKAIRYLQEVG